jgi:hypothetical protein
MAFRSYRHRNIGLSSAYILSLRVEPGSKAARGGKVSPAYLDQVIHTVWPVIIVMLIHTDVFTLIRGLEGFAEHCETV